MSWRERRAAEARSRVLSVLRAHPETRFTGLELHRLTGLSSGRLYPALDRLEFHWLVAAEWDDSEPRRRVYRLGTEGERVTRAIVEGLMEP